MDIISKLLYRNLILSSEIVTSCSDATFPTLHTIKALIHTTAEHIISHDKKYIYE